MEEVFRCMCSVCKGEKTFSTKRTIKSHVTADIKRGISSPWHNQFKKRSQNLGDTSGGTDGQALSDFPSVRKVLNADGERSHHLHGHTDITYLTFCVMILQLQSKYSGMSQQCVTDVLQLIKSVFGTLNVNIPRNFSQVKAAVSDMLVPVHEYDVCMNDCVIFKGDHADSLTCPSCKESRYKPEKKQAQKKYHYLPLIPRLLQLLEMEKISGMLQEHSKPSQVMTDIQHSLAWQDLYSPEGLFQGDKRCLALSYSNDGFQPFHHTTTSPYSIGNQSCMLYNLPPNIRRKTGMLLLNGLTQGPKQPFNMNIYHQLFVEELTQLQRGVVAYDGVSKTNFNLRAAVLTYVMDFPGQAKTFNLQGAGGLNACNKCFANGEYSKILSKTVYLGSRKFLSEGHPMREDAVRFPERKIERGMPELRNFTQEAQLAAVAGRMAKKAKLATPRTKAQRDANSVVKAVAGMTGRVQNSEFERLGAKELEKIVVEMMHGVQVVAKHIHAILNGFKDGANVRIQERKLGRFGDSCPDDLYRAAMQNAGGSTTPSNDGADNHPEEDAETTGEAQSSSKGTKKKKRLPPAPFVLSKEEMLHCDRRLKHVKLPLDGGVLPEILFTKTHPMKSHTWYLIFAQGVLAYTLDGCLQIEQRETLTEFCDVLKLSTSAFIPSDLLDPLEEKIHVSLCKIERDFPISIKTIIIHLLHHLPACIRRFGPIRAYWMYAFEQQIHSHIEHIKNKKDPERTAIEAYRIEALCTLLEMEGILPKNSTTSSHHQCTFLTGNPHDQADQFLLGDLDWRWLQALYAKTIPSYDKVQRNLLRQGIPMGSDQADQLPSEFEREVCRGPTRKGFKYFGAVSFSPSGRKFKLRCSESEGQSCATRSSYVYLRSPVGLVDGCVYFGRIMFFFLHSFLGQRFELARVQWFERPEWSEQGRHYSCQIHTHAAEMNPFVSLQGISEPLIVAEEDDKVVFLNFMDELHFRKLVKE